MQQTTHNNLANAIRALSIDAVNQANSGHPGMPMGMADIATVLWHEFLNHNPNNPKWLNRDRFVLSNGHGSMLLYSLLHLTGYDLSIDDIKNFRQMGSKTPGHPEYGYTPGVETTTGPLGQGLANAVGMAIAQANLAAQFNQPDFKIFDHFTYAFCGDGCLMEGVSHEACSLAGTLGLGKLIAFWDDNHISIDGNVDGWFTDNTPERFKAYGWQVIESIDGHNPDQIRQAIQTAQLNTTQPTLICCKTQIGFGSPNRANTAKAHGAPLGAEEAALAKKQLGWAYTPFEIPDKIYQTWDAKQTGQAKEAQWQDVFQAYREAHPQLAAQLLTRFKPGVDADWHDFVHAWLTELDQQKLTIATRKASQVALDKLGPKLPQLMGGSADLTGSNLTNWSGSKALSKHDPSGNYIYYGVREFGMTAIANGIALYGGLLPYTGTFLVFSDYARNAIRMAALMKIQQIMVYTHDSIGLGEDGPTHQPIEHVASLRLIPNLQLWRPCDAIETAQAWASAIAHQSGPTILALSRQNLPHCERDTDMLKHIQHGGYILKDTQSQPDAIIIATGSEVEIALGAAEQLAKKHIAIRVVSMPCVEIFDQQSKTYQNTILPKNIATFAIEAGVRSPWVRFTNNIDHVIGIDQFGESAPAEKLFEHYGLSIENLAEKVHNALTQKCNPAPLLMEALRLNSK